jgi:hypothetical protein
MSGATLLATTLSLIGINAGKHQALGETINHG